MCWRLINSKNHWQYVIFNITRWTWISCLNIWAIWVLATTRSRKGLWSNFIYIDWYWFWILGISWQDLQRNYSSRQKSWFNRNSYFYISRWTSKLSIVDRLVGYSSFIHSWSRLCLFPNWNIKARFSWYDASIRKKCG